MTNWMIFLIAGILAFAAYRFGKSKLKPKTLRIASLITLALCLAAALYIYVFSRSPLMQQEAFPPTEQNEDVMICDFVIGNIHAQSMQEIITQYDPYQNEWMNALLTGGASALLDQAKQQGIPVDCSQCYSVCDLCHKINNRLLSNSHR